MAQIVEQGPLGWSEVKALLDELKGVARRALRGFRGAELQTTALLDTALNRMFGERDGWNYELVWQNRAHVFGAFREAALRALIDEQRKRGTQKRGRGQPSLSFDELLDAPAQIQQDPAILLDFLHALERLTATDAPAARLAEYVLLWDFELKEAAALVGVSERHARRKLLDAKQRLAELFGDASSDH